MNVDWNQMPTPEFDGLREMVDREMARRRKESPDEVKVMLFHWTTWPLFYDRLTRAGCEVFQGMVHTGPFSGIPFREDNTIAAGFLKLVPMWPEGREILIDLRPRTPTVREEPK